MIYWRLNTYWIVDPQARTVEAYVLKQGAYVLVVKGEGSADVRLPPFEDLAIPLAQIWPEELESTDEAGKLIKQA